MTSQVSTETTKMRPLDNPARLWVTTRAYRFWRGVQMIASIAEMYAQEKKWAGYYNQQERKSWKRNMR
jgi:hypothetical protein